MRMRESNVICCVYVIYYVLQAEEDALEENCSADDTFDSLDDSIVMNGKFKDVLCLYLLALYEHTFYLLQKYPSNKSSCRVLNTVFWDFQGILRREMKFRGFS